MSHILFITTKQTWGGSEQLWCDAAERALANGHQVSVVMPEGRIPPHSRHARLEALGAHFLSRPPRMQPTLPRRVAWRARGIKMPETQWWYRNFPEPLGAICLSQGGAYCAQEMPGLLPWLQGRHYVIVCQSNRSWALPSRQFRAELAKFFSGAARVCFVAEENRRAASRFLAIDLPNAVVVQNPVNLATTDVLPPPPLPPWRMACVARFEIHDKGQDLLLEALSSPSWRERPYELNFFGSGPDDGLIRELIHYYGLAHKISVAGFESDIRHIWANHHLLVLPSLSEGTPLSLIEAQLCGRPALVTRVDGNPEWVEDGVSGFIAEAPTVGHLASTLSRAWYERDRWESMGAAARRSCLAKRDPDPVGTLLGILEATPAH